MLNKTALRNFYSTLHLKNCLLVSFDDRKDLEKEDFKVIKELGLTFRGRDAWVQPKTLRKVVIVHHKGDEDEIKKVFGKAEQTNMIWEADYFWAPVPIREGKKRPYFPVMSMLSDQESHFIFVTQLKPKNNYGSSMGDALMQAVEKHKIYPKKIVFRKPEVGLALGYYSKQFNIEIERVSQLEAINDARHGAFDFFRK